MIKSAAYILFVLVIGPVEVLRNKKVRAAMNMETQRELKI